MGRAKGISISLQDLRTILDHQRFETALSRLRENAADAIHIVESLRVQDLKAGERSELGNAVYAYGKCCLDSGDLTRAAHSFEVASHLTPRPLVSTRLKLLREGIRNRANRVLRRSSLIEMQRLLTIVCRKQPCHCESHFTMASCMGLIGDGLHHSLGPIEVHTLDAYHPRNASYPWTRLLKRVKGGHEADLLGTIADILADFILERTTVLRSADVVVPIPPSIEKYVNRGFAPNDIVAKGLEKRLALPCRELLLRSSGTPTQDASDEELSAQFTTSRGTNLSGLSVLLVEDIWTRGRTIPICAEKLRAVGAVCVQAVALGKTGG
jgi:predicted amidophosphoribosyltransferase